MSSAGIHTALSAHMLHLKHTPSYDIEVGMEEDGVPSPSRPQGQKGEQGVPINLMSP